MKTISPPAAIQRRIENLRQEMEKFHPKMVEAVVGNHETGFGKRNPLIN